MDFLQKVVWNDYEFLICEYNLYLLSIYDDYSVLYNQLISP